MGGPKAYPREASVDTPRLPPFSRTAPDKTATRLQRDRAPMPVGALFRLWDRESPAFCASDVRNRKTKISGRKWAIRNEPLDQSGLTKNIYWPKVVHTGQVIAGCPHPPHQLPEYNWGETAMKWSQAICASILVDEFYLLSLHARTNSRSGRDVPNVPLEPALRPNHFTADWGLPPRPVRTRPPKPQADAS